MANFFKRLINSDVFAVPVAMTLLVVMIASAVGGLIVAYWALRWWVLTVIGWLPW